MKKKKFIADCTPGSLPGLRKKKNFKWKEKKSFEALYLSDKTNRIKIGWEMKEKKQFMWFEEKNSSPQLALSDKANRIKIGQEMREKKHFLLFLN